VEGASSILGDESHSYQLVAKLSDDNVPNVEVLGQLTALYVPLGPDGDNTLAYEHSCTAQEVELNDTKETANSLSGCKTGRTSGYNQDWYSFNLPSGQNLVLETRSADGAGCGGDTYMSLVNSAGTEVSADDDNGLFYCSRIAETGLAPGTYYAVVRSVFSDQAFDYRITATFSSSAHPVTGDADEVAKDRTPR
jgi:hypothetical protein